MLLIKSKTKTIIRQLKKNCPSLFAHAEKEVKLKIGDTAAEDTFRIYITNDKSPGNKIEFTSAQFKFMATLAKDHKVSFYSLRRTPTIIIH